MPSQPVRLYQGKEAFENKNSLETLSKLSDLRTLTWLLCHPELFEDITVIAMLHQPGPTNSDSYGISAEVT